MKRMNQIIKMLCGVMACVIIATVMAGCVAGGGQQIQKYPVTTVPTETVGVTEPTAETTAATEPTAETTFTTEPSTETTAATEPEETQPVETEPAVTQPKETEPSTPAATEPDHTHSYTAKTVAPTCDAKGYVLHSCTCGKSYKTDETAATGHAYTDTVIAPTAATKGYTLHECSKCGKSYKDNYTDKLGNGADHEHTYTTTEVVEATYTKRGYTVYYEYIGDVVEPLVPNEYDVARAAAKYINQFRAAQGSTQLTWLPGMTKVAEYRAVQLTYNFAHDTDDLREALAYYKYGKWYDMTLYGEDASESYYSHEGSEAIGKSGATGLDADALGKRLAEMFLNSSGHWRYVGSSDYSYVGIGVKYVPNAQQFDYRWYICVLVGRVDHG